MLPLVAAVLGSIGSNTSRTRPTPDMNARSAGSPRRSILPRPVRSARRMPRGWRRAGASAGARWSCSAIEQYPLRVEEDRLGDGERDGPVGKRRVELLAHPVAAVRDQPERKGSAEVGAEVGRSDVA